MCSDGAVARHGAVVLPGALVDVIVVQLDVAEVLHSVCPETQKFE